VLIHTCAKEDVTAEELTRCVVELALMGCDVIAEKISQRAGSVVTTFSDHALTVVCRKPAGLLWDTRGIRNRSVTQKGRRSHIVFPAGCASRVLTAVRRRYGDRVLLNIKGLPEVATRSPFAHANDPGVADIFANHDVRFAPKEPEQIEMFTWNAKPSMLRSGSWGARIPTELVKDALPKDGDRVMITTREGKRWPAFVNGDVTKGNYGYTFATKRGE
jgi:hypothetical protein